MPSASATPPCFPGGQDAGRSVSPGCLTLPIGEVSPFHQTFGYYAHGVAEETAILPAGWKDRLIPVRNSNTGNGCGLCLEVHDLAVAKLAAGREKDTGFVTELFRHQLAEAKLIETRLQQGPLSGERLALALARLKRLSAV